MSQRRICINPVCRRPFSVTSKGSTKQYCVYACRFWKGVLPRRTATGIRDVGRRRSIA